jgi:predicted PurR-regulated permease PerM
MESQQILLKNTARLIIATLVIIVMVVGKSFLIPLAWAMLIAMASYPMLDKVESKTGLSRSLINAFFLLILLVVLIGIGFFFYAELSHIFNDMPALMQTISERIHNLSESLKSYGISVPDNIDRDFVNGWVQQHNDMILSVISGIGLNLWNVILIMFYMFFLLYYRDLIVQFYVEKYKDQNRLALARDRFFKSLVIVRSYIYGLLLITIISAVMNYVVFLIFGLPFALFFALFLAVLNLIPFIGNPIGLVVIMLFAFITNDSLLVPALIFITLFVMNFLQDNVIRPMLMGDKMKLNAFAVFVAVIIGGMIWGVSGMILFVPITGIIKIILESREKEGAYAIFFSELPKKPKKGKLTAALKSDEE